jgi:hypothetical protein
VVIKTPGVRFYFAWRVKKAAWGGGSARVVWAQAVDNFLKKVFSLKTLS